MDIAYFLGIFFSGLSKGSIYALIALGYTMVYGIIQLINFAHGEIYMIGAFLALAAANLLSFMGLPGPAVLIIATMFAMLWCAAYGFSMELVAYKPMRGSARLAPLISAIGMSTFLQNYVQLAQTSDYLRFPRNLIPRFQWLSDLGVKLRPSDIVILLVSALVMIALALFIRHARLGKAMRATAQNRKMAMLVGIDADRIISITFIIGSALAALGGTLIATHTGQVGFGIGFIAGLKAFTAAVLGGIGSIPGAMLGGLFLGLAESFTTGYFVGDYEDVLAFLLLILVLIFRPSGIMGKAAIQKV